MEKKLTINISYTLIKCFKNIYHNIYELLIYIYAICESVTVNICY